MKLSVSITGDAELMLHAMRSEYGERMSSILQTAILTEGEARGFSIRPARAATVYKNGKPVDEYRRAGGPPTRARACLFGSRCGEPDCPVCSLSKSEQAAMRRAYVRRHGKPVSAEKVRAV
jgi:hypothetical protein